MSETVPCMFGPYGFISYQLFGCDITIFRVMVLLATGLFGALVGGRGLYELEASSSQDRQNAGGVKLLAGVAVMCSGVILFAGAI